MIIEATDDHFAALVKGEAPEGLRLVADSELAPAPVLSMLADLAGRIRPVFAPAAWLVAQDGELVGLVSLIAEPAEGEARIGYGVAPTRWGRGAATAAVGEIVAWARGDARIQRLVAETNVSNAPSQSVLTRNGFLDVGRRHDPEDGDLICWRLDTCA